jgi:replicative DNA helicase
LHSSDLIILAARPGMGKTSLALSIALNVAGAGGNVGIVSLEMSEQQLLQRLVCMDTGIDLQKFRSGKLAQPEIVQSLDAMGRLSNANIHIDDEAGQNIGSIRAKARNLHTHNRLDLLIVDYLQLGDGSDASRRQANRIQQVDEISRGLKALARELDCPLLALSQLSRAVEGRTSRVPQLSDLRESGQLEADADVVMFIYREEVYDKHTTKTGIAEVYIAKQRNGPLGMASLHFDKRTTRFKSLSNQVYAGNGVHP